MPVPGPDGLSPDQVGRLLATGFQRCRIKCSAEDAWLWERGGRLHSAEAAIQRIAEDSARIRAALERLESGPAPMEGTPVPAPKKPDPPRRVKLPDGVAIVAEGFGGALNVRCWYYADQRRAIRTVYCAFGPVAPRARLAVVYDRAKGAHGDARELQKTLQGWGYANIDLQPKEAD